MSWRQKTLIKLSASKQWYFVVTLLTQQQNNYFEAGKAFVQLVFRSHLHGSSSCHKIA